MRWKQTEWGWNLETGIWTAQVYLDDPMIWRVFFGSAKWAEGPCSSTSGRRIAKAVLEGLVAEFGTGVAFAREG